MEENMRVETGPCLRHTVETTPANEADSEVGDERLHGKETTVHADAGYTGADQRIVRKKLTWMIAMRRGKLKAMPDGKQKERLQAIETAKASIRARVEHPFRVVKRQFGYVKVRFRGLVKNTAQALTLFALAKLWMARKQLLDPAGTVRPKYT